MFVIVRVTLYVPALEYVWVGFCDVELFPSPKFQLHWLIVPDKLVDASWKTVVSPIHTFVALNAGVGNGCTVTAWVTVSLHPLFVVTRSFMLNILSVAPVLVNITEGFKAEELGIFPPNVQKFVNGCVVDWFVKLTVSGVPPILGL